MELFLLEQNQGGYLHKDKVEECECICQGPCVYIFLYVFVLSACPQSLSDIFETRMARYSMFLIKSTVKQQPA